MRLAAALLILILSALCVAMGAPSHSIPCGYLASAFAYIPIFYLAHKIPSKVRAFWVAFGWYALVTLIQLSWMQATTYHGAYILIVYAALTLVLAFQFGLIAFALRHLRLWDCFWIASLWTVVEWARLFFLCGFAFNPAGLALCVNAGTLQLASLFGILGLSWIAIFLNLLGLYVIVKKRHYGAWVGALLFIYLLGYGLYFGREDERQGESAFVVVLQTGLKPHEKMPFKKGDPFIEPIWQWAKIVELLERGEKRADLIVLPESALPFSAHYPLYPCDWIEQLLTGKRTGEERKLTNLEVAKRLSQHFGADVLIGLDDKNERGYTNSLFLLSPTGSFDRYDKRLLVPLAEYLPFEWLRSLVSRYGISSFFTPGERVHILEGKWRYGATICYEECFSYITRPYKKLGAELLVNATNDAYFPGTRLAVDHFDLGRVRAVEAGLPLVRSCNSGVTAVIDSRGDILARIDGEWIQEALFVELPLLSYKTLYSVVGDYLLMSACFVCLLLALSFHLLKKRAKSKFLVSV